jgi:hypothetical protein
MLLRQARLSHGAAVQVAWLDDRPDLKVGAYVILKDVGNGTLWRVDALYHTKEKAEVRKVWNVGGL